MHKGQLHRDRLLELHIYLGLTWHRQYPVFNYLKGFELLPGGVHPTSDIFEAVKTGLGGKNPMLRYVLFKISNLANLANINLVFSGVAMSRGTRI